MLSYFKYYIIKTQQARKSIVLKLWLCRCVQACLMVPQVGGCLGVLGGVEISLYSPLRLTQPTSSLTAVLFQLSGAATFRM